MKIPWSRSNFLRRRLLDRVFLDLPDAAIRAVTGRGHWPPHSLRSFVGGASNFAEAGDFFLREIQRMRLINQGDRILDIGCGCGRVASALAADAEIRELDIRYTGMDVDRAGVEWCRRHITSRDPRFEFYHADCRNPSYNPKGSIDERSYRFPHDGSSFNLILLTSVLTHILEDGLRNYVQEAARLLSPRGVIYATIFLYQSPEQLAAGSGLPEAAFTAIHEAAFQNARGNYALNRDDHPANAVAYSEQFVRAVVKDAGLSVIEPPAYGSQDLLLLTKAPNPLLDAVLGEGWHDLEKGCWRWTKQSFTVHLKLADPRPRNLQLRFHIPAAVIRKLGSIHMSAVAADVPLPKCEYKSAGDHIYSQPLPPGLPEDGFSVRFLLDQAYLPESADSRELGVQVPFFVSCGAGIRDLDPIRAE
jgi:SAM-dependent methyltransferase